MTKDWLSIPSHRKTDVRTRRGTIFSDTIQSMHPNIKALKKALESSRLPFETVEGFPDALFVSGRPFVRCAVPFNEESVAALVKDKDAVYKMLQGKVKMPRTRSFLDPHGRHPEMIKERTVSDILRGSSDFLYPRIVKMNMGGRGMNVFLCSNNGEMRMALESIFDKRSKNYDYLALVQEYIEPKREIRVVINGCKSRFGYERGTCGIISDEDIRPLLSIADKISATLGIVWGSVDFIESRSGELYFIEANTMPSFEGFIEKNGDAMVQALYLDALRSANPKWMNFLRTATDISWWRS